MVQAKGEYLYYYEEKNLEDINFINIKQNRIEHNIIRLGQDILRKSEI